MSRGREILLCGHGEHPKMCLNCENEKLKQQLKDANELIDMVENNTKMPHQHKDYYERLCCLSERAREYKNKYKDEI